jgi:hypothetical protein
MPLPRPTIRLKGAPSKRLLTLFVGPFLANLAETFKRLPAAAGIAAGTGCALAGGQIV